MDQERFTEALIFAARAHHGQFRKGGRVPYVTHVAEVAALLSYYYPDLGELILAGLLHDVVEDTAVGREEIKANFGAEVARLVMAVTKPDDERLSFHEKRQATLEALQPHDIGVLRLKAADALANLGAIRRDLDVIGEAAWDKFKASKEESLAYYDGILMRVRAGIANEGLVEELKRELLNVKRGQVSSSSPA
jgi:(p)ppGpp synthase/HD superfamily hydrolase